MARQCGWIVCLALLVSSAAAQTMPPAGTSLGYQPQPGQVQPRPWDLSVRLFFIYNDNVQTIPDGTVFFTGDKSSPGAGMTVNSAYRFLQNSTGEIGIRCRFDISGYTDSSAPTTPFAFNSPHDYLSIAVTPTLYGRYNFELLGHKASAGMSYDYRHDWLEQESFGSSHVLSWDVNVEVLRGLFLDTYYKLGFNDFKNEAFGNAAVFSRDSLRQTVGVSGVYWFDRNRRAVSLGYQYADNDADGSNYDSTAHTVSVGVKSHLVGPLWGKFDAAFGFEDYDGFVLAGTVAPPGRTGTDTQDYRLTIVWVVTRAVSIDAFYSHSRWDSNQAIFDGSRNTYGLGITYKF